MQRDETWTQRFERLPADDEGEVRQYLVLAREPDDPHAITDETECADALVVVSLQDLTEAVTKNFSGALAVHALDECKKAVRASASAGQALETDLNFSPEFTVIAGTTT